MTLAGLAMRSWMTGPGPGCGKNAVRSVHPPIAAAHVASENGPFRLDWLTSEERLGCCDPRFICYF